MLHEGIITSMLYMNRVGTVSLGPEGAADLRPYSGPEVSRPLDGGTPRLLRVRLTV